MIFVDLALACLLIVAFAIAGAGVAVAFQYVGDKAFDMIAAGQEWQQKKGWW